MRYPTLTIGHVESIVEDRAAGKDPSVDGVAIWRGTGETISFDTLDVVVGQMKTLLEKQGADPDLTTDKEPFEGALAVAIFGILDELPVEVLDDPGFWRFLAMSRFWWFVEWREHEPLQRGNVLTYVDGRRNTETIPLRLYLRAKAVANGSNLQLASELKQCTDFWRSHVTRVRTGSAPNLSAALAKMQKDKVSRLTTNDLRAFARRVNRLWTNVQLAMYDEKQAAAVLSELRP